MQTKLRIGSLLFVASLLWTSPTSAATQKANVLKADQSLKLKYLGTASWYGKQHQGRKMANGKRFDRNKLTAASWYFPLGTTVRVVNLKNGKSVVVTITDRGPNRRLHRALDLSEAAAARLDYVVQGLTPVFLYPVVAVTTEPAELDSHLTGPDSDKAPVEYEAKALNTQPN
jgi:rare lipoprotein A